METIISQKSFENKSIHIVLLTVLAILSKKADKKLEVEFAKTGANIKFEPLNQIEFEALIEIALENSHKYFYEGSKIVTFVQRLKKSGLEEFNHLMAGLMNSLTNKKLDKNSLKLRLIATIFFAKYKFYRNINTDIHRKINVKQWLQLREDLSNLGLYVGDITPKLIELLIYLRSYIIKTNDIDASYLFEHDVETGKVEECISNSFFTSPQNPINPRN